MSKIRVSCKICNKDLLEKNLPSHISTVHEGNKRYKCHLCPHSASTKNFLQAHLLFHKHAQAKKPDGEVATMFVGLAKSSQELHGLPKPIADDIKKTSKPNTSTTGYLMAK